MLFSDLSGDIPLLILGVDDESTYSETGASYCPKDPCERLFVIDLFHDDLLAFFETAGHEARDICHLELIGLRVILDKSQQSQGRPLKSDERHFFIELCFANVRIEGRLHLAMMY